MSEQVTDPAPQTPPAADPKPAQPNDKGELPDWARQQISSANQEAAGYRVQLRTVEQERNDLAEKVASLTNEKTQAVASYTAVQSDFDKLAVAVQELVPDKPVFAFAKTLQGSTSDELAAHAAELTQVFNIAIAPDAAVDRSQGHGGEPNTSDPATALAGFVQSHLTR